jgi:hypothetical protein
VVERPLERLRLAGAAAATAATAPAAAAARRVVAVPVAVLVLHGLVLVLGLLLRLALGLQSLGHEGVVLGAQVELLGLGARDEGLALARFGGRQVVLALEGTDIADRHVQLMGDPRVGAALTHPGADLVELRLQRSTCQTAADTTNPRPEIDVHPYPERLSIAPDGPGCFIGGRLFLRQGRCPACSC